MLISKSKYIQRDNVEHVTDVCHYHNEEIAFFLFIKCNSTHAQTVIIPSVYT